MRDYNQRDAYIAELFAPETPLIKSISERVEAAFPKLAGMQIGPAEGRLLQWLIRQFDIKTVIEIGSFGGYSAAWMAGALPAGGTVHAITNDPGHFALLEQTARLVDADAQTNGAIIPHFGNAREILPSLSSQAPFDMAFIDADKPSYPAYLDWAEANIRPGGLIIGDNTLLFDQVYRDEPQGRVSPAAHRAMRTFNERLADRARFDAILIPTIQGMTVAVKR